MGKSITPQLKISNLDYWGPGEFIDTHTEGVCDKNEKGTLSVPRVPSLLKMLNLDCWSPGESIDTQFGEVGEKVQNFEFPAKRPLGALGTFGGRDPKPSYQVVIRGS